MAPKKDSQAELESRVARLEKALQTALGVDLSQFDEPDDAPAADGEEA